MCLLHAFREHRQRAHRSRVVRGEQLEPWELRVQGGHVGDRVAHRGGIVIDDASTQPGALCRDGDNEPPR
jgi:hypothetical protein